VGVSVSSQSRAPTPWEPCFALPIGLALLLAFVPVRLEALAVLVLAHLFATLLDDRTHAGDPRFEIGT